MNAVTLKIVELISANDYGSVEAKVGLGEIVEQVDIKVQKRHGEEPHSSLMDAVEHGFRSCSKLREAIKVLQAAGVEIDGQEITLAVAFYEAEKEKREKEAKEKADRLAKEQAEADKNLLGTAQSLWPKSLGYEVSVTYHNHLQIKKEGQTVSVSSDWSHGGKWVCDETRYRRTSYGRNYREGEKKASAKLENLRDFVMAQLARKVCSANEAKERTNSLESMKGIMVEKGYAPTSSDLGTTFTKGDYEVTVKFEDKEFGKLYVINYRRKLAAKAITLDEMDKVIQGVPIQLVG